MTITGLSRSRTYRIWENMRARCDNPQVRSYRNYGGRGISYDPRWAKFECFLADMGEAPARLQIDRRDNDGNYNKENCRWTTCRVNQNNRRNNRIVEFGGKRQTLSDLALAVGMHYGLLRSRIERGLSITDAVELPVMESPLRDPITGVFIQRVAQ